MTPNPLHPDTTPLARVLHSADAAVSSTVIALDPQRIDRIARKRFRQRRLAAGAITTGCLLIAGYVVATRLGPERKGESVATIEEPTAAELLAELNKLNQQFDSAIATAEQLLASTETQAPSSDQHFFETLAQQTRLARLQEELARLEAASYRQPADDWQLAWLRTGAKRLALAGLDAESNPGIAAESYRRLAANYAGSPISDAAQQALNEMVHP